MSTLAASPLLVISGAILLLAVILLGRRIEVRLGSLHAELKPNGGSSVRDAIDRIEAKADAALSRIEALEGAAPAAIVVNAMTPPAPGDAS